MVLVVALRWGEQVGHVLAAAAMAAADGGGGDDVAESRRTAGGPRSLAAAGRAGALEKNAQQTCSDTVSVAGHGWSINWQSWCHSIITKQIRSLVLPNSEIARTDEESMRKNHPQSYQNFEEAKIWHE